MDLHIHRDIYFPDYDAEKQKCYEFLSGFQDPAMDADPIHHKLKYMVAMQRLANREAKTIDIEVEDLEAHFDNPKERHFVQRVQQNTNRYVHLLAQVIDQHMPAPTVNFKDEDLTSFDIIMQQRKMN